MEERFGGYTLIEPIGVGGMAEVFLARREGVEGFEKEVVIKRIRPQLTEIPSFVNMFLGEAKLAAQLTHPNIVQIYDLGKIDEAYFIAMEYVPGRDMSALIPKCKELGIPFPIEYAVKIASSVCEALHYAHTKTDVYGAPLRIVHRDVSPENIRVAWTGTVKILDFGIAKAATTLHETKTGEIKGKLSYMSPEQVMGKEVDQRSDIFSLGVVLYESLTGLKLFTGDSDLAIMNNVVDGKIYPPSYFRDDVPRAVEDIIMKALDKDRKRRFQNPADMQFELDSFLSQNEFTPSNIHLSNFLKQLFHAELEAEQGRRLRETPTAPPPFQERRQKKRRAPSESRNEPLPEPARAESGVYDVPQELMQESRSTTGLSLLVSLEPEYLDRLQRLAQKRSLSVEAIAKEVLEHYLKYYD